MIRGDFAITSAASTRAENGIPDRSIGSGRAVHRRQCPDLGTPCPLARQSDSAMRGAQATCSHCERNCPIRWKGYLHCLKMHQKAECFVCLTPKAGWEMLEQVEDGYNFRGRKIYFSRQTKSPSSLLLWRWDAFHVQKPIETEEKDPRQYLDTVFRKAQRLAFPN